MRGGSIEQRPAIVDERSRIGDWEAYTIIGKNHKQAIVSLVERKSGFLMCKVERKTALAVSDAMTGLLKLHRRRVHTITSDNGREFAGHETISKQLKADFYFAPPLCVMGAMHQREYQRTDPAVLPQGTGLHHHHAAGN